VDKVKCIKGWRSPLNNASFKKDYLYEVISYNKNSITILDYNPTTMMSKGGRHTIEYKTFQRFFDLKESEK